MAVLRMLNYLALVAAVTVGTSLAAEPLRRGNGPEPDSLDPQIAQGLGAHNVLRDLFEGLVREAPDGSIIPAAAMSWQVSDQGRLYRFSLRRDGSWSNGQPVVAADFVYALRRAANPATGSSYGHLLSAIKGFGSDDDQLGVTAAGDHDLVIRLDQATPQFLRLLTLPIAFPLHQASIETHGPTFTRAGNLISNGPYTLTYWRVNERMDLTRNGHYRDPAPIESVVYYHIDNPDTELQRFRAGELDITEAVPPGRVEWMREHMGDQLRVAPYLGTFFLGFNLTQAPFQNNPAIREALSLAVDRERLVSAVLKSGERPAYGVVPQSVPGYVARGVASIADMTRDQRETRAKQLYADAGYDRSNPLEIQVRFNTSPLHRRTILAVSAMWRQVLGVRTRLINEEWKVFVRNRRQREVTQLFRWGWIGDFNDPVTFLDLFRSGQALNNAGFSDARFDQLLDEAAALSGADRLKKLGEAEDRVIAAHAVLPLYSYVSKHLVSDRVSGWQDHLLDRHPSSELSWRVEDEL